MAKEKIGRTELDSDGKNFLAAMQVLVDRGEHATCDTQRREGYEIGGTVSGFSMPSLIKYVRYDLKNNFRDTLMGYLGVRDGD